MTDAAGRGPVLDVYARLSRAYNGETIQVDDQVEVCLEELADRGARVGEVFKDNSLSAWKPNVVRKQWEALMRRLESGQCDGVIVFDLTRFSRKIIEGERLVELAAGGIRVWSSSGEYDLATADGRRHFREAMVAAAGESDKISERVRRGKLRKARRGKARGGGRGFGHARLRAHPRRLGAGGRPGARAGRAGDCRAGDRAGVLPAAAGRGNIDQCGGRPEPTRGDHGDRRPGDRADVGPVAAPRRAGRAAGAQRAGGGDAGRGGPGGVPGRVGAAVRAVRRAPTREACRAGALGPPGCSAADAAASRWRGCGGGTTPPTRMARRGGSTGAATTWTTRAAAATTSTPDSPNRHWPTRSRHGWPTRAARSGSLPGCPRRAPRGRRSPPRSRCWRSGPTPWPPRR